jgi:hypothetical protein
MRHAILRILPIRMAINHWFGDSCQTLEYVTLISIWLGVPGSRPHLVQGNVGNFIVHGGFRRRGQ